MDFQNTRGWGFFHLAAVTAAFLIMQTAIADSQEKSVQLAHQAVWAKPGSSVQEVSTEELQLLLKDKSTFVLDARPPLEWSISHIPGLLY